MSIDAHSDTAPPPAKNPPESTQGASAPQEASVGLFADFWGSFRNGLASQANGAIQLADRAGTQMGEFQMAKVDQTSMGTGQWAAEMGGQIAAVAVTMGAMRFGLGRVAGALMGTTGDVAAQSILRQTAINGGIGAVMGGVLTPSQDPNNFWSDRFHSTLSSTVTIGSMGGISALSTRLAGEVSSPALAAVMRNGFATNAVGGYAGGVLGEMTTAGLNGQMPDWSAANRAGIEMAVIGMGTHGVDLSLNAGAAQAAEARRAVAGSLLDFADVNADAPSSLRKGAAQLIRSHVSEPLTFVPITKANVDNASLVALDGFHYAGNLLRPDLDFKASLDPVLAEKMYGQETHRPVDARYYAAVDRHQNIVGTTGLYRYANDPTNAAWLGWFTVKPEARGHGIGNQLMDYSLAQARQTAAPFLRLYTSDHPGETAAQHIYEKNGLRVVGQDPPNEHGTTILYREKPLYTPLRETMQNIYARAFAKTDANRWTGRDGADYRFSTQDPAANQSWKRLYRSNFPDNERQPEEFLTELTQEGSLPHVQMQVTERNGVTTAFSVTSDYGQGTQGSMLLMPYVAADIKNMGIGAEHVQRTLANLKQQYPTAPGMIIEMEPTDTPGLTPEALKQRQDRLRFWTRNGGQVLDASYTIPSSVEGEAPLPLKLLWVDFNKGQIDPQHLNELVSAIYRHGYQLPDDDAIVQSFHSQFGK